MAKRAIGNMYIHNREELNEFLCAVEDAAELFEKAEDIGMNDIQLHLEAVDYGDNMFRIELKGETTGCSDRVRKEVEDEDVLI